MSDPQFFDLVARVDVILGMEDVGTAIPELRDLLQHIPLRKYFFEKLRDARWLQPLADSGFFDNPDPVTRDPVRGTSQFPLWPESGYLARMASHDPDTVLRIALRLLDTENINIHENLADAALAMPAPMAAEWVKRETRWIERQDRLYFLLPSKLGSLITHLARGGQIETALDLAAVLLRVLPGSMAEAKSETEIPLQLAQEPRSRLETGDYQEILKKHFPEVVKMAGVKAFDIVSGILEAAICLSRRRGQGKEHEDLSYIWRRAIEDHAQDRVHTLKNVLVSGVRDAAELLAQGNRVNIQELVSILESRPWRVFHRIALHLLRRFPDAAPDLVTARLLNRSLFDMPGVRHEYVLLLRQCFDALMAEQQRVILGWIDEGPDLMEFAQEQRRLTGKEPADEDLARWKRRWQRDRLAWLHPHLTEYWKQRYEALVAEFGEPEHPEFGTYITSWTGPTSPKSAGDLRAMSVDDIIDFLSSWRPEKQPMSPSPEGLGRLLEAVVSEGSDRFAANAERFQGLDPTYVRSLISGFREAVKKSQSIDWPAVLGLCRWVMEQPRENHGRSSAHRDTDPDWGWTRKSIAELLSAAFDEGVATLSFDLRQTAWLILSPLTDDPEPSPEYEAHYGGSNTDPATLSINTTRGEAMHAVVRYGLWVRRHFERLPDAADRIQRGFDEMPEVRDVLDKHLDVARDPSLAVRAVYGQWFPWLVLLDKSWARNNVGRIFPSGESEKRYRDAAWETYIFFCSPYDEVFEVLRDQYAATIERLDASREEIRQLGDPDDRLAEHLMTFYWRGKLNFGDPDGILAEFWRKASDPIRGHALSFTGRSLYQWKDIVPLQPLQRLKALWGGRLTAAKEVATPDNYIAEMSAFGWWFVSEKFEDGWAIKQLDESLKIAGKVEPEETVVERLASLSQNMPREAVQCLEALVKGDKEGWSIHGWREHMRTILGTALREADPETRIAAENLVHYLGSRGYFQFRDLLQSVPPAGD